MIGACDEVPIERDLGMGELADPYAAFAPARVSQSVREL
jgi:hypothetical protein